MRQWDLKFGIFLFVSLIISLVFYFTQAAAAPDIDLKLKIYSNNLEFKKQFSLPSWSQGYSLSLIDLGGDGQKEILWGAGANQEPVVKIFRSDGSIMESFLAYDKNFKGGIQVVGCDVQGNNQEKIVTVPGRGGGPQIRIFDSYGEPVVSQGFFAFDKNNRNGLRLGCADINGDKIDEIVVLGENNNKRELHIFDVSGKELAQKEIAFDSLKVNLSRIDLGGDGVEEILVVGNYKNVPKIAFYRGDLSLIGEFALDLINFQGGVEG